MNNFTGIRRMHLLVGGTLLLAAGLSQAQYVWINENGVRQISDKAPPASIPAKNILKAPGGVPTPPVTPPAFSAPPAVTGPVPAAPGAAAGTDPAAKDGQALPAVDAPGSPKAASAPMTLAEREADYKRRMKAAAEKEEKEKAERKAKAAKKAACDSAKQYKATLDSGTRIVTMSPSGEAVYMEDAERKQKADQAKRVLDDCR